MSFLSPWAIAIASAVTIPPLIALYFLKLKRAVHVVPSTLLWKRTVEDLQVNAPFQRLRSSLLLLLQLLVLIAAAIALGQPMFQTAEKHEGTAIILIDQSASMNVREADGLTRLEKAKEQAKLQVDNLADDARIMVIAFCDRATVVSSFDTNKQAVKRKIDTIEPTESTSSLTEAISLAEAYSQNILIGTEEAGAEKGPVSGAPPASVFVFSDGRIEHAERTTTERLDISKMRMTVIGSRGDNVAITAMDARRDYDRPEILEVTATVANSSVEPRTVDAVLYVDGNNVDVQTIQLEGRSADAQDSDQVAGRSLSAGRTRTVVFDEIVFGGGGVVEVVLRVDDALTSDDRAWAVIDRPRDLRVLLVTEGNLFLENVLATLPLELVKMTPDQYESADDAALIEGKRSVFDVVIFDRHSTGRLPHGNYMFWGAVPKIEGVSAGRKIDDEVIFSWDETHPVLRHVAVDTLYVYEWLDLTLPAEAASLVDGQTSSVLAYLARDGSQYLISAFPLVTEDDAGAPLMNTHWVTGVDFVVFMQNAMQFLSGRLGTSGRTGVVPGEPVTVSIPTAEGTIRIIRPDGSVDEAPATNFQTLHYARTRRVGVYRVEPGVAGADVFVVNLFNAVESDVKPVSQLTIGTDALAAQAGSVQTNAPAWPFLVGAILVLLLLEWVVYNQRVFV